MPREVITELRERGYLKLVCGHYTAKDTQHQYLAWRPKGKAKYFCEEHGSWQELQVRKVRDIPENPLF